MNFSVAGVGVTGLFAIAVFIAFALFSFMSVFSGGKFGFDKLARAVRLSLRPLALVVAFVSLIAGGIFLLILTGIGSLIGAAVGSVAPAIVLTVIGAAGLVYALFASAYMLNFLAISGLRDDRRASLGDAWRAFLANQWQVLLLPVVLGGLVLLELGLFALVGLGGRGEDSFAFIALFAVVFFPVNLVVFILLFFGCGIFLPVMVDRKAGAWAAVRAVATAIKQQTVRLLSIQTIVISFLGMAGFVLYLVYKGAASLISVHDQSPIMMITGELMKSPLAIFQMPGDNPLMVVGVLCAAVVIVLVLAVGASIVWSLNMSLYSSLYLGHLKESVDFNEPVFAKKKK